MKPLAAPGSSTRNPHLYTLWCNRSGHLAVSRKVGGSSPLRDASLVFVSGQADLYISQVTNVILRMNPWQQFPELKNVTFAI